MRVCEPHTAHVEKHEYALFLIKQPAEFTKTFPKTNTTDVKHFKYWQKNNPCVNALSHENSPCVCVCVIVKKDHSFQHETLLLKCVCVIGRVAGCHAGL